MGLTVFSFRLLCQMFHERVLLVTMETRIALCTTLSKPLWCYWWLPFYLHRYWTLSINVHYRVLSAFKHFTIQESNPALATRVNQLRKNIIAMGKLPCYGKVPHCGFTIMATYMTENGNDRTVFSVAITKFSVIICTLRKVGYFLYKRALGIKSCTSVIYILGEYVHSFKPS